MLALRVLAALVACLPWRALGAPGALLGVLAGSLLRVRRRHVVGALTRARVAHPGRVASAMYRALGRGVFELMWLAGASAPRRERVAAREVRFAPGALEALEAALEGGPVMLAASHTGNWELVAFAAAVALRARGRKLAVVAKPITSGPFDRFMRELRASLGVEVIAPAGAARACLARLAAGDVVVAPVDQVPARVRHGVRLAVHGAEAWVDRSPFALAARARATVLVVAARREGASQEVVVLDALLPEDVANVPVATRRAASALEAFVARHPETYLWLHRRWRVPAEAPACPSTRTPGIEGT